MSNFASYASVALPTPGKKGILKKLDNDYYEIIVGAFGAFGNGGWLYDERTAIDYFNNNPEFLELLRNRRMRSEWGHPVREPGMSDMEWLQRIHTIHEPNWSSHIRALHLSSNTVRDEKGRSVVAIIAEVTPCGPHAESFRRCLENPDEDMNYSVRSFARKDFRTQRKHISKIITFDSVWNPGIKSISKFNTPSLESSQLSIESSERVSDVLDQAEFHLPTLRRDLELGAINDASFESNGEMVKIIESLVNTDNLKVKKQYMW